MFRVEGEQRCVIPHRRCRNQGIEEAEAVGEVELGEEVIRETAIIARGLNVEQAFGQFHRDGKLRFIFGRLNQFHRHEARGDGEIGQTFEPSQRGYHSALDINQDVGVDQFHVSHECEFRIRFAMISHTHSNRKCRVDFLGSRVSANSGRVLCRSWVSRTDPNCGG